MNITFSVTIHSENKVYNLKMRFEGQASGPFEESDKRNNEGNSGSEKCPVALFVLDSWQ